MERLAIGALLDLEHTLAASLFDGCDYPWEVLSGIEAFILSLGPTLDPEVFEKKNGNVWVAKNAAVSPTAFIGKNVIIGENCEVRHGAFIRGNAIVGRDCVVGNSTELKNVILFDRVQVPHYNYVGDSVLGYRSHMGAGAITSNVKSDKSLVCVNLDGRRIETGRKKFGAILGDRVEIGCSSVLNPGAVIGRDSNVYPLSSVRGFVAANSIFKRQGVVVDKR